MQCERWENILRGVVGGGQRTVHKINKFNIKHRITTLKIYSRRLLALIWCRMRLKYVVPLLFPRSMLPWKSIKCTVLYASLPLHVGKWNRSAILHGTFCESFRSKCKTRQSAVMKAKGTCHVYPHKANISALQECDYSRNELLRWSCSTKAKSRCHSDKNRSF